jgi:hypothetical protein
MVTASFYPGVKPSSPVLKFYDTVSFVGYLRTLSILTLRSVDDGVKIYIKKGVGSFGLLLFWLLHVGDANKTSYYVNVS